MVQAEHNLNAAAPVWSPFTRVSPVLTDAGPNCSRREGIDWIVWKGATDNQIWYTNGTQYGWSEAKYLGARTNYAPAIASYQDQIYIFWTDADSGQITYAVYDGNEWKRNPDYYVNFQRPDAGPELAVYDGRLYVTWKRGNFISYTWLKGKTMYGSWDTYVETAHTPAIAAYGDKLYFAFAGKEGGTISLYSLYGNIFQKVDETGTDTTTFAAPSLASDGEKLWMMWNQMSGTWNWTFSATRTADTGWTSPLPLDGVNTYHPVGLCGDSCYLRVACTEAGAEGIDTNCMVEPGTSLRLIPPEITGFKYDRAGTVKEVEGNTASSAYVSLSVSNDSETRDYPTVQAGIYGTWAVKVDATMSSVNDIASATTTILDGGTPSDAGMLSFNLNDRPSRPQISSVTQTAVSGFTTPKGPVIKGWRASDGTLVVDYTVPTSPGNADIMPFSTPYLHSLPLEQGDTICLVAQNPTNGTMSYYAKAIEGYCGS